MKTCADNTDHNGLYDRLSDITYEFCDNGFGTCPYEIDSVATRAIFISMWALCAVINGDHVIAMQTARYNAIHITNRIAEEISVKS